MLIQKKKKGTTTRRLVRTSLCNIIFCDFARVWCPYFPLRHGRSYHHQWSVSWLLTQPNCRGKQRRPENLLKSNDYWIQMTHACTHLNSSSFLIGFRSLILQNRRESKVKQAEKEKETKEKVVRRLSVSCLSYLLFDLTPDSVRPQTASSLFLAHNTALVPPYRILIDTNFINFSLQNKLELVSGMMDCLYAKCRRIHSQDWEWFILAHLYRRYPVCHWLCSRWAWETRFKIPPCTPVSYLIEIINGDEFSWLLTIV